MKDIEELDQAREEMIEAINHCLMRLSRSGHLMFPAQRLFIAEKLRDVADTFDHGEGDRLRHRLQLGRFRLVTLKGPNGRPLYRLE